MSSSRKFESLYKVRLEALIAGYSYKNFKQEEKEKEEEEEEEKEKEKEKEKEILIPTVILKTIERWYSGTEEPKLQINPLTYFAPMQFEIYFHKTVQKILNVTKYKLKAKQSAYNIKTKNQDVMYTKEAIINYIYDNDYYIAIWTLDIEDHEKYWFDCNHQECPFNVTLMALDENNTILCILKKRITKFYSQTATIIYRGYEGESHPAWRLPNFDSMIDQTNDNKVNIHQFLNSIKRIVEKKEFNDTNLMNYELMTKRYFYFVYSTYNDNVQNFGYEFIDFQNLCNCMIDITRFDQDHFIYEFTKILRTKLGFTRFCRN